MKKLNLLAAHNLYIYIYRILASCLLVFGLVFTGYSANIFEEPDLDVTSGNGWSNQDQNKYNSGINSAINDSNSYTDDEIARVLATIDGKFTEFDRNVTNRINNSGIIRELITENVTNAYRPHVDWGHLYPIVFFGCPGGYKRIQFSASHIKGGLLGYCFTSPQVTSFTKATCIDRRNQYVQCPTNDDSDKYHPYWIVNVTGCPAGYSPQHIGSRQICFKNSI